jgi:hypothetical protein
MAYAPAQTRARPGFSLLFVVYVAIGAVVASRTTTGQT